MRNRADNNRQNQTHTGADNGIIRCCRRVFNAHRRIPIVKYAGAGATVPIIGFGYSLCKGAIKAVNEKGLMGVMTGGITATAGGITAAILFGYLAALFSKPRLK